MSDVKHTPGPWTVASDPFEVWTSKGPGYGLICHCAPYCPPHPDSEQGREFTENARLIAAAPELLEALRIAYRLLGEIKQDGYAGIYLPTLDWAMGGDETGDSQIVTAIAKAEGRKP